MSEPDPIIFAKTATAYIPYNTSVTTRTPPLALPNSVFYPYSEFIVFLCFPHSTVIISLNTHSAVVLCIGYAVLSVRQEINSYVVFKRTPVFTGLNELSL